MELEIIDCLSKDIIAIYDVINTLMDTIDGIETHNQDIISQFVKNNNENVEKINLRLNTMDLDIEENDKIQTGKKEKMCSDINSKLKEERKKNGLYKTDLIKKLSKINRENNNINRKTTDNMNLLQVEVSKNNKNKDILNRINSLQLELKESNDNFHNYKNTMIKTIDALKREIKIRTRIDKMNGIKII